MSQSLATYPLLQCVVSAAQFASGEVSFYDAYAELMAADAEGGCTSPLHIDYDVLEHFRIVRAQRVMRLTLPHAVVLRWAERNGFASQLDACDDEEEDSGRGTRQRVDATHATSAVLLLQLRSDNMSSFLQTIAPLVAASRRTRSASRISVTEPLPLYETMVDPAPYMPNDSRASSSSSSSGGSQCDAGDTDLTALQSPALGAVAPAHDERRSTGLPEEAITTPSKRPMPALNSQQKTPPDLSSSNAAAAGHRGTTPALLGGGNSSISSSGNNEIRDCNSADATQHPEALRPPAVSAKTTDRAVMPHEQQPLAARDTLESIEAELVGLLDATELSQMHATGNGGDGHYHAQPLKRPDPVSSDVLRTLDGVQCDRQRDEGKAAGRAKKNKGVATQAAAAHSLCPSLASSAVPNSHGGPLQTTKGDCKAGASSPAEQATAAAAATTKLGKPNRLVIAHLCASDGGSPISAEAPAAESDDIDIEQNALETVATVTVRSDRAPRSKAEKRLESLYQPAEATQKNANARDVATRQREGGVVTVKEQLNDARGAAVQDSSRSLPSPPQSPQQQQQQQQQQARLVFGSSSPASSSVRLGEMLRQDNTSKVVEGNRSGAVKAASALTSAHRPISSNSVAVGQRAAGAAAAAPTCVEPRTCVRFDDSVNIASSAKVAQRRPLNAEVQRDVKSYLLDLFPKPSKLARQPNRRGGKTSAADSDGAAATAAAGAVASTSAAPRRRGRPPKPQTTAKDLLKAVASKKQIGVPLIENAATRCDASFVHDAAASRELRSTTIRKRNRSGSADGAAHSSPGCSSRRAGNHVGTYASEHEVQRAALLPTDNKSGAVSYAPCSLVVCDAETLGLVQPTSFKATSPRPKMHAAPLQVVKASTGSERIEVREEKRHSQGDGEGIRLGKAGDTHRGGDETEAAAAVTTTVGLLEEEEVADAATPTPTLTKAGDDPQMPQQTATSGRKARALEGSEAAAPPVAQPAARHGQRASAEAVAPPNASIAECDHCGSDSSSKATCPLFYRRDSRKERTRRLLRYMNVVSQTIAAMHETHDELRGLVLTMINENQL